MLSFIYTAEYDDEAFKNQEDCEALVFNIHVHTIADKYTLPGLSQLSLSKFTRRAESDWKSAAFATAISEVYNINSSTKSDLKDVVIEICHKHGAVIFSENSTNDGIVQTTRDVSCFGTDLLLRSQAAVAKQPKENRYWCPDKQKSWAFDRRPGLKYFCPYCQAVSHQWIYHVELVDE